MRSWGRGKTQPRAGADRPDRPGARAPPEVMAVRRPNPPVATQQNLRAKRMEGCAAKGEDSGTSRGLRNLQRTRELPEGSGTSLGGAPRRITVAPGSPSLQLSSGDTESLDRTTDNPPPHLPRVTHGADRSSGPRPPTGPISGTPPTGDETGRGAPPQDGQLRPQRSAWRRRGHAGTTRRLTPGRRAPARVNPDGRDVCLAAGHRPRAARDPGRTGRSRAWPTRASPSRGPGSGRSPGRSRHGSSRGRPSPGRWRR